MPIRTYTSDPVSARAMTKKDIRDLRRWHRNACLRAKAADYDLICLGPDGAEFSSDDITNSGEAED